MIQLNLCRSKKEVSRWSPDDLGTPTGMKDEREKSVLGSLVRLSWSRSLSW